jgi:hypothetical protein
MPSAPRQPYADSDRELARQVRRDWEHYREVAANPRRAESSVRSALRDVFWSLLGYGDPQWWQGRRWRWSCFAGCGGEIE